MKNTMKLLTVVMIAVLALSIAGCGSARTGRNRKNSKGYKINLEEIQKNQGTLLVIRNHPQEAMTKEDYDRSCYEITISYDGYVKLPGNLDSLKMKDEDFVKIYEFCTKNAEKSKFANYSEDVCDGETYTFTHYDTDGNPHVIYDGYCYNNNDLQDILNTAYNYQLDK
jgi:hypothetical protein